LFALAFFVPPTWGQDDSGTTRRQRQRGGGGPSLKVAEAAPDFKLKQVDDASVEFHLRDPERKKPVVLIFGSYT
jgi:hypothetical protein